jgi:hypothetical protein
MASMFVEHERENIFRKTSKIISEHERGILYCFVIYCIPHREKCWFLREIEEQWRLHEKLMRYPIISGTR